MPDKFRKRNFKYTALSILIVMVLWYLATLHYSQFVVPSIRSVVTELAEIVITKELYSMIWLTVARLISGIAIGVALGTAVGILIGTFSKLDALLSPMVGILQTVPPVSWVVLALVWFGFNGKPSVFIVVTSTIPVIAIGVAEGIRDIDKKLIDMAKLYSFSSRKTLKEITLPAIGTHFKSSFRIVLGNGWKIAVMGEVLTTSDGIGGMIKEGRLNLEPEAIFAWSIIVVLLFYLSDFLMNSFFFRGNESLLQKKRPKADSSTPSKALTKIPRRHEICNKRALDVKSLSKSIDGLSVIDDMSFYVREGEIVALIGPSGCGKTTLLNIISGLLDRDSGEVTNISGDLSFVFQDSRLLPWRTVYDNIKVVGKDENESQIAGILRDVELDGFEDYYPNQISGGMEKRCSIARAFYKQSKILLMDEPFSSLDYCLRHEMIEMTRDMLSTHRQSVLLVTHEIDAALRLADRIIVLSERPTKVVEEIELSGDNRDPDSEELLQIRRRIIKLITKETKDELTYNT